MLKVIFISRGTKTFKLVLRHMNFIWPLPSGKRFGLTLLEAIGSGLVMVGTDVPYGNPTFIKNDRNGFLVPFVNQSHEEVVADLKRSMQKAFGNLNFLREGSYKLAERYMTDQIIGQWREFFDE